MTQRKNKHWGGFFAGDADDYTVRGACAFDLNPLAPTRPVATVCLLGDDTFEAGNFAQPLLCQEWVRSLKNQLQAWMEAVEELLERSRKQGGVRVFWRGAPLSAREILRFLRDEGGIFGILIDQDTRVAGHFVPFFGRPAFTPRAAGDLAAHLGAPLLFACAHRLASGVHRIVVRRIEAPRTGDRDRDSFALTAAATKAIEDEVRKRPDEWVWMHPRWRTQQLDISEEK